MLKVIVTIFCLGMTHSALAALIPVTFSGSLNRITYSDCLTYGSYGSCTSWRHDHQQKSSFFDGQEFSLGQKFSGQFSFDSKASFTLSNDGYQAVYANSLNNFGVNVSNRDIPNKNLPTSMDGSVSVVNDRYGRDSFFVEQWFNSKDWFATSYINLIDFTGKIYNDFKLPTTFNLEDYTVGSFHIGFLRKSDGDQLHVYGNIDNVQIQEVGAPNVAHLIGLGFIIFLLRKTVRSKFQSSSV